MQVGIHGIFLLLKCAAEIVAEHQIGAVEVADVAFVGIHLQEVVEKRTDLRATQRIVEVAPHEVAQHLHLGRIVEAFLPESLRHLAVIGC